MAEDIYIGRYGRQEGPFTLDEVLQKVQAQEITGETLAWKPGEAEWRPLRDVVKLAVPATPPAMPPVIETPAEPKPSASWQPPGSESPVPASAMPASPYGSRTEVVSDSESGASWFGLSSFAWGIFGSLAWLTVYIFAGIESAKDPVSQLTMGVLSILMFGFIALNLLFGLAGIVGVFVDAKRIYAFIGIALNTMHVVAFIGLLIIGAAFG